MGHGDGHHSGELQASSRELTNTCNRCYSLRPNPHFCCQGYGDKVPITSAGRVIAMIFMTVGIALFGVLSGHLSASFVESRSAVNVISEVSQLSGARVGGYPYVLETSYALKRMVFDKVPCYTMADCGTKLQNGEIDALVYDEPVMSYWRDRDPWAKENTLVIGETVSNEAVGVIFPEGGLPNSNHTMINAALIDYIGTDDYMGLRTKWFPPTFAKADTSAEPIEWPLVIVTLVCVISYVGLLLFRSLSSGKIDVEGSGRMLKRLSTVSSSGFKPAPAAVLPLPSGKPELALDRTETEETEVEELGSANNLASRIEAKLDRLMETEAKLDQLLKMQQADLKVVDAQQERS